MLSPAVLYSTGKPPQTLAQALNPQQPAPRPVIAQTNGPRSDLLAKALLASAAQGGNIETPMELLGRLAQTYSGNTLQERYLKQQKADADAQSAADQQRKTAAYGAAMRWLQDGAQGDIPPEVAAVPEVADAFLKARLSGKDATKPTPYTDLAKLRSDYNNGLIDETQYNDAVTRLQTGDGGGAGGTFGGTSVEAQGLNILIDSGILTKEQAGELAASKQITDPATGTIYLALPSGIFRQVPGSAPEPVTQANTGAPSAPAPAPGGAPPAQAPAQPPAGPTVSPTGEAPPFPMKPQTPPGFVPLTQGKPDKTAAQEAERGQTAGAVIDALDRAIPMIKARPAVTTGVIGALSQSIPGTPAFNVKSLLDTVRANVGFDKLNQMRASSPTGGALGQVSEFENRLLQSVFGNIEQAQSTDQLLYNLQRIRNIYGDVVSKGHLTAIGRMVDAGQITYDEGVRRAQAILDAAPAASQDDPLGLFQ